MDDKYQPESKTVSSNLAYQYVIKAPGTGMFRRLDQQRTFGTAWDIKEATLFGTAAKAEEAIAYRNKVMGRFDSRYSSDPYLVVPVKVTETTKLVPTPVTTFVDTLVTETIVELA